MPPTPRWSLVALAVAASLGGASCTSGNPDPSAAVRAVEQDETEPADAAEIDSDAYTTLDEGVLTVCADVPFPPFSFADPDAATGYGGFDLDLVAEVAAGLDLDVAIEEVAFEAITSGAAFTEGRCDVAASALMVADEWRDRLGFTAPYYEVKQSLVVLEGEDAELAATGGMRVGVQAGMPAADFLDEQLPVDAEVVAFDNTTDLRAALDTGAIDAVVLNLPTSTAWVAAEVGVAVVETFVTDDAYAIAVEGGRDDALLRLVDAELARLRDDGTRDRLLAEHFALPLDDGEAPGD